MVFFPWKWFSFFIIKKKKDVQLKKKSEIYSTWKYDESYSMLHPRNKALLPVEGKRDVLQNPLWDNKEKR